MQCNNIDEVISTLTIIVEECKKKNCPLGYFAVLYRKVTIQVKEGIQNQRFEDNTRMEKLDVYFANRYFRAYFDFKENKIISNSWKTAMNASKKDNYIVLQHLLLGINAHINLDLGVATINTIEKQPLDSIKNDFYEINKLLSDMTEEVKKNMGSISPIFGLLMPLAKKWDDILIQFSITTARDGAWEFAKQLHQNQNDLQKTIQERDAIIAKLGIALISPVKTLQWILHTIRFWERKTVSEKITILEAKL